MQTFSGASLTYRTLTSSDLLTTRCSVFGYLVVIFLYAKAVRQDAARFGMHLLLRCTTKKHFIVSGVNLITTSVFEKLIREPDRFVVFNKANVSDIGIYANKKRVYFDLSENGFIPHRELSVLRLSENNYRQAEAEKPLEIDVLILSQDRTFSIEQLTRVFYPKQVVLDSSLPLYIRNRLMDECAGLGIPAHDVSQDGAFFINL